MFVFKPTRRNLIKIQRHGVNLQAALEMAQFIKAFGSYEFLDCYREQYEPFWRAMRSCYPQHYSAFDDAIYALCDIADLLTSGTTHA